jgi:hypothetical protein
MGPADNPLFCTIDVCQSKVLAHWVRANAKSQDLAGWQRQLALFRTMGPTDGSGSLGGPCPLLSVWKLALFFRGLLQAKCVVTIFSQSTCTSCRSGTIGFVWRNCPPHWRRFQPNRAVPLPSGEGVNWVCLYSRPDRCRRWRLRPPRTIPVRAGKLGSFVQPVPTTASSPTSPVPARSCRGGGLALFGAHGFGVPRLRGWDRSFPGTPISRSALESSRSRPNPPTLWSLDYDSLLCCPVIIQKPQFLVK